jgi:hypothetical protein
MIDVQPTPIVAERNIYLLEPRKLTRSTPYVLSSDHGRLEFHEAIVTKACFSDGCAAQNRIRLSRDYGICVYFDGFAARPELGLHDRKDPVMVVYPLAFHRRSERKWRRKADSSFQIESAETPPRRSDQCPRCCILAAGPLVSVHRPRGIAYHWQCKTCECDWDTFYRPSLV